MDEPGNNKPNSNLLHRRLVGALMFSLAGLKRATQEEACWIEMVLLTPLIILGFWLGETPLEKLALVCPLIAIFVVELLNTAIEVTVNRISTERHELSKQAKDLGSAAVFVAMVTAAMCWLVVLM